MDDNKLEYFIRITEKGLDEIKTDLKLVHEKLDQRLAFEMKMTGVLLLSSAILAPLATLFTLYIGAKQ